MLNYLALNREEIRDNVSRGENKEGTARVLCALDSSASGYRAHQHMHICSISIQGDRGGRELDIR